MLVSIIVPTHNQEKTIYKDIKRIYETMEKTRWEFEIIVVSDGSSDKTLQEAQKLARKKANLQAIGYETNRGKGYAVRYGMARAEGDFIAFIDSGMEIDPNGISMILEHMQWYEADIIVGSKKHPVSKVRGYSFIRRIYSWGYHVLTKIFFRLPLGDTQTGLKVFRRKVLEKVLPRIVVKKFAFDVELLAVSKYLGFNKIYEAPVKVHLNTKLSNFKKPLILEPRIRKMIQDTLAVFYRMYILRYYHPDSKQKWKYDKELEMRVNTGKMR
jgi:glycosyltransferase involved in cell wall biosynthesis